MGTLVRTNEDFEEHGTVYFINRDTQETEVYQCSACEAPLIRGYVRGCFIGVQMKCARCDTVSKTPMPENGDILQSRRVNFFDEPYRVPSPVEFDNRVSLVTDTAVETILKKTRPRTPTDTNLNIGRTVQRYSELTGRTLSEIRDRSKRFQAQGRSGFMEEPIGWCARTAATPVVDRETALAKAVLLFTDHADQTWRHHPRYEEFAHEMHGSGTNFFHTLFALHIAESLYNNNRQISFLGDTANGKNPDLYLRLDGRRRYYIEVKFPSNLTWCPDRVPGASIQTYISKVIKKNKQINEDNNGYFAFGLLAFTPEEQRSFLRGVQEYFSSGTKKRSCLGAFVMSLGTYHPGRELNMERTLDYIENPGYNGWVK